MESELGKKADLFYKHVIALWEDTRGETGNRGKPKRKKGDRQVKRAF